MSLKPSKLVQEIKKKNWERTQAMRERRVASFNQMVKLDAIRTERARQLFEARQNLERLQQEVNDASLKAELDRMQHELKRLKGEVEPEVEDRKIILD